MAVQRRHLHALARDPAYAELLRSRGGRGTEVRSADGTRLHAETFGAESGGPIVVLAHGWTERLRSGAR